MLSDSEASIIQANSGLHNAKGNAGRSFAAAQDDKSFIFYINSKSSIPNSKLFTFHFHIQILHLFARPWSFAKEFEA